MRNGKTCVYTAVTGAYDQVLDPAVLPKGVDFICFSD